MTETVAPRPSLDRVVVVGASLAGLRAAETLRQHDHVGSVVVIGDELHRPYDRPPLSKKLLAGDWEPDGIALRKPEDMGSLSAKWRTGVAATAAASIALRDFILVSPCARAAAYLRTITSVAGLSDSPSGPHS